jgi:hypothetical protein
MVQGYEHRACSPSLTKGGTNFLECNHGNPQWIRRLSTSRLYERRTHFWEGQKSFVVAKRGVPHIAVTHGWNSFWKYGSQRNVLFTRKKWFTLLLRLCWSARFIASDCRFVSSKYMLKIMENKSDLRKTKIAMTTLICMWLATSSEQVTAWDHQTSESRLHNNSVELNPSCETASC